MFCLGNWNCVPCHILVDHAIMRPNCILLNSLTSGVYGNDFKNVPNQWFESNLSEISMLATAIKSLRFALFKPSKDLLETFSGLGQLWGLPSSVYVWWPYILQMLLFFFDSPLLPWLLFFFDSPLLPWYAPYQWNVRWYCNGLWHQGAHSSVEVLLTGSSQPIPANWTNGTD